MDQEGKGIAVHFNSACPVCDAGIRGQRRRMPANADVHWSDINDNPMALSAHGVVIDDVRLKLHLVDEAGDLHVGIEAFRELWARTPRQRWLATALSWRPVASLATWAYDLLAEKLYRWNRRHGRW